MTPEPYRKLIWAGLILTATILPVILGPYLMGPAHLYAQEAEIYIDNAYAYQSKNRAAVYFSHENHMENHACLECHHDYQNGENVLDEDELADDGNAGCLACHSKGASIELKTAYHRQCMGCHRSFNKEEAAEAPITCRDCHPRR